MKRLIALGDSITRGTYTAEGDWCPLSLAEPNFAELVRRALGFDELINYGVNGVSVSATSNTNPEYALSRRIAEAETGNTLLVAGGTNDYGTDVELGKKEDREDVSFYGALRVLFDGIRKKGYRRVYVVTPLRRREEGANGKGYTLTDYRKAIAERAAEYGFPVVDGTSVPIDPTTEAGRRAHILDGLHPNEAGHALYAQVLVERMREYENGGI